MVDRYCFLRSVSITLLAKSVTIQSVIELFQKINEEDKKW